MSNEIKEIRKAREPLIHIAKRDVMPWYKSLLIRVAAVAIALLLSSVLAYFLIGTANPFQLLSTLVDGSFGSERRVWKFAKDLAVMLCISLAVTPAFRMKFWNIGAEGQVLVGALAAIACAFYIRDAVPNAVLLVIMAVAAMLAGAIWGVIPAIFKAVWNTNETLFTLMMNYIIIGVVKWLQGGPWEGRPGSQIIPQFNKAAVLPKVFGVHCGWIIVLVLTVLMFIYMKYTKHGYEITVIGESENTARYAGMNVGRIVMRTMFISGAISGLVGFIVSAGANTTLYDGVAAGVGFTAITVAWLAKLNPFGMVGISVLLAVLEKGADTLQTRMAVPASISDIITGIFLFCMLGCEFFIEYKMIFRSRKEVAEQ